MGLLDPGLNLLDQFLEMLARVPIVGFCSFFFKSANFGEKFRVSHSRSLGLHFDKHARFLQQAVIQ